jgi:hypothetical protein
MNGSLFESVEAPFVTPILILRAPYSIRLAFGPVFRERMEYGAALGTWNGTRIGTNAIHTKDLISPVSNQSYQSLQVYSHFRSQSP